MDKVRVRNGSEMSKEIEACLAEARGRTFDALKKAVDYTAIEVTTRTRSRSPHRTGVYRSSWANKQTYSNNYMSGIYGKTVYNKKKPSLTHLLQYGHEVEGYLKGKGRSQTRAFDHILSDDETEKILERNLQRELVI